MGISKSRGKTKMRNLPQFFWLLSIIPFAILVAHLNIIEPFGFFDAILIFGYMILGSIVFSQLHNKFNCFKCKGHISVWQWLWQGKICDFCYSWQTDKGV